ncbi:peptidase inhibitor family I36 protein [Streptosporangium sp. NPDC001559]|uniref:peptidase inhibitor family I36 protein n=1 Tax=Streptosporangium sp. NPDC001559 TaxID=3366187 RepID=UPI0036EC2E82
MTHAVIGLTDCAMRAKNESFAGCDTETDEGVRRVRKRRSLAVVMAVCAVATLVTAIPAEAKLMDWDACPEGYVCLYSDTYGRGRYSNAAGPNNANVGAFINDMTSSIWNRTHYSICFYQHADFGGAGLIGINGYGWVDNVGSSANDRISSYHDYTTSPGGPCIWAGQRAASDGSPTTGSPPTATTPTAPGGSVSGPANQP